MTTSKWVAMGLWSFVCLTASVAMAAPSITVDTTLTTDTVNLTTDGTTDGGTSRQNLDWMTWDAQQPTTARVVKNIETSLISYSTTIPQVTGSSNGMITDNAGSYTNWVKRSWTDGKGTKTTGTDVQKSIWVRKYDADANSKSIIFDIAGVEAYKDLLVKLYVAEESFATKVTATLLDSDTGLAIDGESATLNGTKGTGWRKSLFAVDLDPAVGVAHQTLRVTVVPDGYLAANWYWAFNAITVAGNPVPEPATLALLALGGAATLLRRRRA